MHSLPPFSRLAAYYRTSSDQQEADETIEAQRLYVRRWCERQGATLAAEFSDDGVSGLTELRERSGFTGLLRAAERGEFGTLIVFAVDRLGREAYYVLHAFHELRKFGIPILSATQSYDPHEATGRLLISFLAGQAESEKITIHNRTEAGKERLLATDHFYLGGVVPYGYRLEWRGEKQVYAVCEEPIPGARDWTPRLVIEHVFDRCDSGWTLHRIARELTAVGVPTCWVPGDRRYGKPSPPRWDAARVQRVLALRFYVGEQIVRRRDGPLLRQVPAIVPVDLWERCRAKRRENRTMADRGATRDYLLRGKITCGCCGGSYCGGPPFPGTDLRHYRCNWRSRRPHRSEPCPGKWVPAEPLEARVKERIRWILSHVDEFVEELIGDRGKAAGWAEERLAEADRLDHARAALSKRQLEYYRQRAEGLIPSDLVLRHLLDETEAQAAELARIAVETRQEALQALGQENAADETTALLRRVSEALDGEPTPAVWRQLIGQLVREVRVETTGTGRQRKATARILWQFGALLVFGMTYSAEIYTSDRRAA